ncbi:MAG: porin [Reyranella sp.]|uniref:porin n=1 Tax=Reyranella sp. TaxID=1929291 RepID=UPI0025D5AEFC|nr:porin [Reyranella sp.]MBR2816434.1 porin [Reyranella sp.]
MKKLLLGSTALVVGGLMAAPAMAADPIKIGVGGYYQFYAIAGGIDSTVAADGSFLKYKSLNFQQEGEIHFIGQTKLDNGTTVGLHVELEGWNPSGGTNGATRTIDEAFLFAFGDWGRLEFGGRDPASYRMYYGTPSALLGFGAIQHNTNFAWANGAVMANNKAWFHATTTTNAGQFQDGQGINYFTPRFAGLQIGVGYRPKANLGQQAGALSGLGSTGPSSLGAGVCGFNDPTTAPNCPSMDYSWQDVFDVGVNYLNKFGDVTVALYGAFMYASFIPGMQPFATQNYSNGANLTSWKQWVVGAQFGYAGFTVGGAIGYDNNGLGSNYYTNVDNDTRFYTAGIMYETGPWQMSFNWVGSFNTNGNGSQTINSIAPGTSAMSTGAANTGVPGINANAFAPRGTPGSVNFGQESVQKFEVGINYALGPGVKLTGGGLYYAASGPSNAVSGNSWGLLVGMDLRF